MSNVILQAFAKLKKTDFYQINVSWINTSISTGFRVIEIPFIINFLTRSSNATENISLFGVLLSVIVASTGITLSLATPTSLGENPGKLKFVLFNVLAISSVFSIILLLVLYGINSASFAPVNLLAVVVSIISAIVVVSIRRLYQGCLIYEKKSWVILFSSILRICTTVGLCIFLPATYSTVFFALAILISGASIDTLSTCVLYKIHRDSTRDFIATEYRKLSAYLQISSHSIIYTVQNYIIIFGLNIIFRGAVISDWIVLYSFLSIFLGIFVDIENISATFHIKPKNAYKILLFPGIISIALFYLLNINPWGIEKYFAAFQGVEDFAPFVQTRILLITIIAAFLFKQYLKGVLIYQKKITSIKALSYLNVLGLSVSGLLLWFFPQSLLITGSLMYLASVLFETVFSVSAINRR